MLYIGDNISFVYEIIEYGDGEGKLSFYSPGAPFEGTLDRKPFEEIHFVADDPAPEDIVDALAEQWERGEE